MKGIDPKYVMYLGLLVTIEQAIGHGTVSLTNLVPADWAPYITSWCNFLAFTGTSIMTYQAAVSSPLPGPLANTPLAPIAKPVIALAVLLTGLTMMVGNAHAAPAKKATTTCAIPYDPLKLCGALSGNAATDIQRVATRIASISKADLLYAAAKAKSANTAASAVRLQCIQAVSDANDQFNGVGLKKPDGSDMVRPDPALATAIEDIAELIDNLSPQGKLFTSCAGFAQMFKTDALTAVNGLVTGAVGLVSASAVGL